MKNNQILINIGPREADKRLVSGIIMAIIGLVIFLALLLAKASIWWNLVLFFPFMGAFIGFLQAKNKT